MNNAAEKDHLPPSETSGFDQEKDPETPPLCSHTAQVRKFEHNRVSINDLCKKEVVSWLKENGYNDDAKSIDMCGETFVRLRDDNGHEKFIRMRCKHDYCPICGKDGSQAHKKRYGRALDRLLWAKTLGYMVFTLPKEISLNMPGQNVLSDLSLAAWKIVKKNFTTPGGMSRVHLMGEEPENLHVHINVLFPITDEKGKVSQETLDRVRSEWTEAVNEAFKLGLGDCNCFYKFAYQDGRKIHQVKYVLRPIVTPEKFLTIPEQDRRKVLALRGWHNTRWFGKLANSGYKKYLTSIGVEVTVYEDKDITISRRCPICGEKFLYVEVVPSGAIDRRQLRAIDRDTLVDFSIYSYLKEHSPG